MPKYLPLEIQGDELFLLVQKAIYWPKEKLLILSDWHLGKASHFRKEGVYAPKELNEAAFLVINELLHLCSHHRF